jgi:hypothetical protein
MARHWFDCNSWKFADAQDDCDKLEIVPYPGDPTGGLRDCDEFRYNYEGHGTGCQGLTNRIKVCLDALPTCQLFDIDDTGCSTFDDLESAEKHLQALTAQLGGSQCVNVSANQCTASNLCQNRYSFMVMSNGVCGLPDSCSDENICHEHDESAKCKKNNGETVTRTCCCEAPDSNTDCKWKEGTSCSDFCFSGDNIVQEWKKGKIAMDELEIGDFVKIDRDRYDRIYGFGHYDKTIRVQYLQIYTTDEKRGLIISPHHLLFLKSGPVTKSVQASTVTVGDTLVTSLLAGEVTVVTRISSVSRSGAFAPFTATGTIVVNDLVASSYVSLQESADYLEIGKFTTPFTIHWLSHSFTAHRRMICAIAFSVCRNETYDSNGYATWVAAPLQVARTVLEFNILFQMLLLMLFIVYAFFVNIFATFYMSKMKLLLALFVLAYFLRGLKGSRGKA